MNTEWALNELNKFLLLVDYRDKPGLYAATYVGSKDEIEAQKVVVEKIWVRVLGRLTATPVGGTDPNRPYRDRTIRAIELLEREEEIRANLDDAPDLIASNMHPWVWEGARSLWESGHYAEAVQAAARKVNAETQNKVGRRDVSETDLMVQAFSDDPPRAEAPRLRPAGDDDGKTARNLRRGIRMFAEGCFAALRNPGAHDETELDETAGLERLAAFSILARWIDDANRIDA